MSDSGAQAMRESQDALKTVTDLASAHRVGTERVGLLEAFHRVLAEDIVSDIDLPPFRQSTRDGFACRRADLSNDLEVVEAITAGIPPQKLLGRNECAKVMTGAAIPQGADCVVMIEHAEHLSPARIRCDANGPEDNICPGGAYAAAGETILPAGEIIEAQHVALLASVGCSRPLVSRRPTVGVIATGSELVEVGRQPGPCQIRNSNSFQLAALVLGASAIPRNYGLVADDREAIETVLRKAMAENDVVVLSGGIAKGDHDFVRGILEENLVDLILDGTGANSGRPVLFGVSDGTFCFGLSGNPVSNFIMFALMVKPFLYALAGHRFRPALSRGELAETVRRRKANKDFWLPVTVAEDGQIHPVEHRGPMGIHAMCKADGVIHVPAGRAGLTKGATVVVRGI
jgi:molybdopterin molybdotransferase